MPRDRAGWNYASVTFGTLAFLAASVLAIDIGMLMTARSQAQRSARAGALAGANALRLDDDKDPAVVSALSAARANLVMGREVAVGPANVEFLNDDARPRNRVRVTVRATVPTLVANVLNILDTATITAVATAELNDPAGSRESHAGATPHRRPEEAGHGRPHRMESTPRVGHDVQ